MPPPVLLDPQQLDLSRVIADREAILRCNPQRDEFQLLDAVVLQDSERGLFAGYHDLRPDAWWARGHIPGRPLFPGVLMIEVAAQLASYVWCVTTQSPAFMGFAAVDEVKYRGPVEPPARFVVIGAQLKLSVKRTLCAAQGFVDNRMVFEARITGLVV